MEILSQQPSLLGDTHPFPGNDDSLDLSGALVDLVDFGIAHQLLSGVVGVEAVAAKDLDAVGGGLVGDITSKAFGNGGVQGVLLSNVGLPGRLHVCQPGTLGADGHVSEHEADRLVVDDGRAKGLPLIRVLRRLVQGSLADAHRSCSYWRPSLVKGTHGNLEARTLPNEHILLGHNNILEGDAPGVARPLSHVDLLPARGDARSVSINDEPCESLAGWALGVGVRSRQHKVVVCHSSIGDPHLLAVDHPLIPLLLGLGLHSAHIAASAGLRHTIGAHKGLLNKPSQVLLLLFMVASDHDWHRSKSVGLDGRHDASATVSHLFSDQATVQCAKSHATVFLGDVEIHETSLVSLLEDWPWVLSSSVIVGSNGDDLVLGELLGQVEELLLLFSDGEVKPC